MSTVIKLKRGTTTPTTSDITAGEVAVDTSAQKLYINDSGTVKEIGGGTAANSFTTINVNNTTNVVADSSSDTLNLNHSGLVGISANATNDTIDVGTPSAAQVPFIKSDGTTSSDIDLITSGKIGEILQNLYVPFTKSNGTSVTTLVLQ